MFQMFRTLILIIWLVDILNVDCVISGIHLAEFLDTTLPLNGWFWLLLWILIPSATTIISTED